MNRHREDPLETLNEALLDLGRRRASGELDADSYRTECYHLLARLEDNGLAEQRHARPTAGIPRRKGVSLWFWLVPIFLALIFLGGLAGILLWIIE